MFFDCQLTKAVPAATQYYPPGPTAELAPDPVTRRRFVAELCFVAKCPPRYRRGAVAISTQKLRRLRFALSLTIRRLKMLWL